MEEWKACNSEHKTKIVTKDETGTKRQTISGSRFLIVQHISKDDFTVFANYIRETIGESAIDNSIVQIA